MLYSQILRPLLFRWDAEDAHEFALRSARWLARSRWLCDLVRAAVRPQPRPVHTLGLTFPNPVGLAAGMDKNALAPLAVALWGVGVVLYLMLAGLVTAHLLDEPVTPHALSPTYWVYMGATAITVLAAAKILALPADLPVLASTGQVVSGLAFLLWAFGTWWIPLLLFFAVWRHLVRGAPVSYEPTLWSMVFPLGMYAAATATYGRTRGLGFMVDIARVEVWAGFAAWLSVAVAMGAALLRR